MEVVWVVEKVGVEGHHAHTEDVEQMSKLDEEAVLWASLRKPAALVMQKRTMEAQRMPVLIDLLNG
jgi:hypothetical protein